eukprot:TRINITY_DN2953_c0_g1_i2.p1 TRINITY_DN2953_c0_g1~~TRINITY_DN2953_c0_g1_i2.p1  ORF type:complete len:102 (+),score=17.30 TRINITY_DN2953_c0_g1_i2:163-468(+)
MCIRDRCNVMIFTPGCRWLDILEVRCKPSDAGESCTNVYLKSYSSGFLPLTIPLAPLLNFCLFFVPFAGIGGVRLGILRDKLASELQTGVEENDTCCGCCA